jgi:DNA-directed RNA polymerase sigma subunit (sigma70/sigma32)
MRWSMTARAPTTRRPAATTSADVRVRVDRLGMDVREREIVQERLEQDSVDATPLAVIGERHGVTRERIRQMEMRLKDRLRRVLADVA